MKQIFLVALSAAFISHSFAQETRTGTNPPFIVQKIIPATPVKNQAVTGTCWCFSTTSLIESQALKNNLGEQDISEMYTVYHIYLEKAQNYVLRQGHAQFSEGGLGHDVIRSMATNGALPESAYSGLKNGATAHNHEKLSGNIKKYLDSILKIRPLPQNWIRGVYQILDNEIGTPPGSFEYKGRSVTPYEYAKDVLKFNPNDYVFITSFTHHPYYESFVLEVPDNFSNGAYFNLPLKEMIQLTKDALAGGYSVMWDADVSNQDFMQRMGVAMIMNPDSAAKSASASGTRVSDKGAFLAGSVPEIKWSPEMRQQLFENLTTQDDHLMHITGLEKSTNGTPYFLVKNSWGEIGPAKGYIHVSEPYFAINTISLIIPRAALNKDLQDKVRTSMASSPVPVIKSVLDKKQTSKTKGKN